jgi:LytS/YehU family sensor histidine kinase
MYALEQQSLNSSMNRHFIFNALNAIQFYINKEEKRAANKYLTSFAKLIRKNLDSTADIWVSLHDELERLELYLGLEQMRFSDRFDYRIVIAEGLDTESLKVPAMTLQPYLENSIWHGILPKEQPGTVEVNIEIEHGRLKIAIQDDGIGIENSLKKKMGGMKDHESKGLQITDDRIQLFSKITGLHFEIRGPYQLEENGLVLGTRTEIFIPI